MNFEGLTQYIDSLGEKYDIPACDLVVSYKNEIVYRHMAGYSDLAKSKKVSENDLYFLYSATKMITCTAALRLIDQGLMKLEDEVRSYLPEFCNMLVSDESETHPAKKNMTIKDLFTMCAGLTYNLNSNNIKNVKDALGDRATTRDIVRLIAKDPLIVAPRYAGVTIKTEVGNIVLNVAFVLDENVLHDQTLIFEKYKYIVICMAPEIQ